MEAAERTARQKEQAEKDKIERMNADLKEAEWLYPRLPADSTS